MRLLPSLLLPVLSLHCLLAAPQDAARLELQGDFRGASNLLQTLITNTALSQHERSSAEFELDRLARIKIDFPFSADELFEKLKTSVKDLTRQEYDAWVKEGRFDSRMIDGQERFMGSSVANLFFRHRELTPRRLPPRDTTELQRAHLRIAREIRNAAADNKTPYVLPKRFSVSMTVTVQPAVVPSNELVRAWLPVPRRYPFQNQFRLLGSSPAVASLASEDSPVRSAYLEQRAVLGQSAVFKLDYEYSAHGVWFNPTAEKVKTASLGKDLEAYMQEAPHVAFTPEMRDLLARVVGKENNPCRAAKSIYDWISTNIKYSYALEYSTIRNLGEYCRQRGYGDCGQEALLLITLCRMQGIPARWQSGWSTFPGAKTIHDWAEIYLEPYGWIPVDVYMGIYAEQYADALTPAEKHELRDFYFGGLDQYRIIANCDHSQELTPPKKSMRSDTVDFQRGELEWGRKNIYFDEFKYDLQVREIPEP